jgi:pimeloyl-ACP methyl ester carboxylesterase
VAESKFVEAGGLRIHYLEAGAGTPLVLLHGGLATSEMSWSDILPRLVGRYHVFAPDTRGHGKTDNPGRTLAYPQFGDDLAAFIDTLGIESPLIFGYSDGGQAVLEFGLRHKRRARALVCGGIVAGQSPKALAELKGWGVLAPGQVDFAQMQRTFGPFFDAIQAAHTVYGPEYWRELVTEISRLWIGVPTYSDEQLRSVEDQVLVITGDRDELGAIGDAPRLLNTLPRAELAVIPNAGHSAIQTPLFWDAVLDFLGRHA